MYRTVLVRFEQVRRVFLLNHIMQMSDTGGQTALKRSPKQAASPKHTSQVHNIIVSEA